MAGDTQTVARQWSQVGDDAIRTLVETVNQLIDDLETLRAEYSDVLAKLDADEGITDTDYASEHDVAAGDLDAGKLSTRETGTP